ncbi:MAG: hypothetical protein AB8G05_11785 [Oligoflexales bacterium]
MKNLIILAIVALMAANAHAKTIFYGSERENISLSHGLATLIRFDEEVKTITQARMFDIKPANPDSPDYHLLSIEPRSKNATGNVTFILANDVVVNIRLSTVHSKLHESTNTFYAFKAKSLQIDPLTRSNRGNNVSELELMKAMVRSDTVVGYKTRTLNQVVRSGIDGVTTKLIKVYTGPKFHGYLFKIVSKNKDDAFALDVKSLTFGRPNVALLSQVDSSILYSEKNKNETFLRVVTKPSSVYYAITLPIAPIKQK